MAEHAKRLFKRSLLLPVLELVVVSAFLVSFAFYARNYLVEGNHRHDFVRLLFFACIFGGAFIAEARLYALLRKGKVLIDNEQPDIRGRWRVRFDVAGYVLLIVSAIAMIVVMNLRNPAPRDGLQSRVNDTVTNYDGP